MQLAAASCATFCSPPCFQQVGSQNAEKSLPRRWDSQLHLPEHVPSCLCNPFCAAKLLNLRFGHAALQEAVVGYEGVEVLWDWTAIFRQEQTLRSIKKQSQVRYTMWIRLSTKVHSQGNLIDMENNVGLSQTNWSLTTKMTFASKTLGDVLTENQLNSPESSTRCRTGVARRHSGWAPGVWRWEVDSSVATIFAHKMKIDEVWWSILHVVGICDSVEFLHRLPVSCLPPPQYRTIEPIVPTVSLLRHAKRREFLQLWKEATSKALQQSAVANCDEIWIQQGMNNYDNVRIYWTNMMYIKWHRLKTHENTTPYFPITSMCLNRTYQAKRSPSQHCWHPKTNARHLQGNTAKQSIATCITSWPEFRCTVRHGSACLDMAAKPDVVILYLVLWSVQHHRESTDLHIDHYLNMSSD